MVKGFVRRKIKPVIMSTAIKFPIILSNKEIQPTVCLFSFNNPMPIAIKGIGMSKRLVAFIEINMPVVSATSTIFFFVGFSRHKRQKRNRTVLKNVDQSSNVAKCENCMSPAVNVVSDAAIIPALLERRRFPIRYMRGIRSSEKKAE